MTRESSAKKTIAGGILLLGLCFISLIFYLSLRKANPANSDFITYWAAEKVLVQHGNPYDPAQIFREERSAGMSRSTPEITPYPPILFFVVLPLGMLSATNGLILWSILNFVCLSVSLWLIWRLFGRRDHLLILLGYLFAPALMCIKAAQVGIFLLLALVLFLSLYQKRPYLAGLALTPLAIKPHLFLPLFLAFLAWQITRSHYRILAGFLTGVLCNIAVTYAYAPAIWHQYGAFLHIAPQIGGFVPSLSSTLRHLIAPEANWVAFVPTLCAGAWALWYFRQHRDHWDWSHHGLVVLLVSLMTAPYAWFTDESMLLPAVLSGLFAALDHKRSILPLAVIGGAALVEVLASVQILTLYYLWTTPAWLIWYLYATRTTRWNGTAA